MHGVFVKEPGQALLEGSPLQPHISRHMLQGRAITPLLRRGLSGDKALRLLCALT